MIIFLLGFMGSGKSYWARQLSLKLGIPAYDLDKEVANREGKPITAIFKEDGEEYFRGKEKEVLHQLTAEIVKENSGKGVIIACGGGTPCFYDNMQWMNRQGITVWLNPPVETLVQRLSNETEHRPLVRGKSKAELESFIVSRLEERKAFYQQSKIEIANTALTVEKLLKKLSDA
ncbi:MAG: shikimate kinase [Chitinophagaceae bacterium]|nr:shikimate kinase [Chitinophagaceae bacterium]